MVIACSVRDRLIHRKRSIQLLQIGSDLPKGPEACFRLPVMVGAIKQLTVVQILSVGSLSQVQHVYVPRSQHRQEAIGILVGAVFHTNRQLLILAVNFKQRVHIHHGNPPLRQRVPQSHGVFPNVCHIIFVDDISQLSVVQ